ncbi:MAG: hypothetical protein WAM91_06405 [Candidatus Acidiferrales bacterium]
MWRWNRIRGGFVFELVLTALSLLAIPISAQQQAGTPPPQNPPTTDASTTADKSQKDSKDPNALTGQQTGTQKNNRIFGIIPNHNTVEGAIDINPISPKEKFKLAFANLGDPYTYGIVGILAGESQAADDDNSWGQGMKGFGKRYAAALGDQTVGPLMSTGLFPSLLREDPRYFQLGKGGFKRRFKYSMSRLVITRTDSGHAQFNYSEFLGNAAATGLSNIYYPAEDRYVAGNLSRYATQIAVDALGNFLKEFWPDMKRKITGKKPVE